MGPTRSDIVFISSVPFRFLTVCPMCFQGIFHVLCDGRQRCLSRQFVDPWEACFSSRLFSGLWTVWCSLCPRRDCLSNLMLCILKLSRHQLLTQKYTNKKTWSASIWVDWNLRIQMNEELDKSNVNAAQHDFVANDSTWSLRTMPPENYTLVSPWEKRGK